MKFCFASTAGQFSGKVIYKCKFVGVALVSRDSLVPRLTGTKRVTRDTALVHVFLDMATRTQVWISAEVLLIHTWERVRVAISINTRTHAVSRVTGLVPRRTRKSGNETMFTNIIRPPGSLPQAVPLVKQNIKLVWPYSRLLLHPMNDDSGFSAV